MLRTLDGVMLFDRRQADRGVGNTVQALRGRFRESGEPAFGKQRAQATDGCRRRQEVRPERAQRSARAEHRTPGPQGDAQALPVLALISVPQPHHPEEYRWLSNLTDFRRKNCRP